MHGAAGDSLSGTAMKPEIEEVAELKRQI